MCSYVCALCTIVPHNIAQNRPDSFPPYPPDDHHSSDDVYLREGGVTKGRHTDNPGGRQSIRTNQQSTSMNPQFLQQMPFLMQTSQLSQLGTGIGICWIAYPHGLVPVSPQYLTSKPSLKDALHFSNIC